jgi:hypothetical protein
VVGAMHAQSIVWNGMSASFIACSVSEEEAAGNPQRVDACDLCWYLSVHAIERAAMIIREDSSAASCSTSPVNSSR